MAQSKKLRQGFSTGTTATAAALAAASYLFNGELLTEVLVRLPGGEDLAIKVPQVEKTACGTRALVIKDAGDDPDITNHARIWAEIIPQREPGLIFEGGSGVGRVTKPGLVLPVGEWAINPGPRGMLNENLQKFISPECPGLKVIISVEKGAELAQKTLNPRLGILGGLSILGTTGLVKPFSHEAYTDTIQSALNMATANGATEVVLTTGGLSEKYAMAVLPHLPEEAFIQIADYNSEGLKMSAAAGLRQITLAVFFGKALKQATGVPYTHAHQSDLKVTDLLTWFPHLSPEVQAELNVALTARSALDIFKKYNLMDLVPQVADRLLTVARTFAGPKPKLAVIIFDYDGTIIASQTPGV